MKKLILMLLVLVCGVGQMKATDYYIGAEISSSWSIQGQLTDADDDGTYSLIVTLPTGQDGMYFTIFPQNEVKWGEGEVYRPDNASTPWITNSVHEINMLESNSNGYSIYYPINNCGDSYNNARAIKIEYTPSTQKLNVKRLIVVASGYNGWSTTTDYLEETTCGSKIYTGKVELEKNSPNYDDGFKFVYIDNSNQVYGGKNNDGYISNAGGNYIVDADGVYTLSAQFNDWKWTDPVLVTVSAALTYQYATFSSEYALDFTGIEDVKAYQASMDGTKVKMTRVSGKVPANTGLFIAGTTTDIPTTICTTELTGNLLHATTGEAIISDNLYSFVKRGDDYGFAKVPSGYTWAKGKAYLETSEVVSAAGLGFYFDDDPTAIYSIDADNNSLENNEVFNLAGQKVVQPSKGLYIVNGKKYIK